MTVDTQKLRELIAAVHEASDIHGEQAWYEPPGTLYIDPVGVGKADFDYIAYLSPWRVSALLDEIDRLRAIIRAIDSLRGPFMSDDDVASVWKLVDAALNPPVPPQGEKE